MSATPRLMQSGAGMVPMFIGRVPNQWRQVVACLEGMAESGAAATGKRSAGAVEPRGAINFGGCVAPRTASVPDGNHGDNFPGDAA